MTKALLTLGASLFAISITAASAQPVMTDFDTNADSMISQEEFTAGFGKGDIYQRWDADQSGIVSQEEFTAGSFRLFDRDRDGNLDEEEFARAAEGASLVAPEGAPPLQMSAFDTNTDNMVSEEEFRAGTASLGDQGPFAAFDADRSGDISQEEFAAGAFRFNDRNRDASLDQEEFASFGEDAAFMQQQ